MSLARVADGADSGARYSAVAMALHWLIAGLILANIWFGWRMGQLGGLTRFETFQLHKSIGVTVLLLGVARVGWRIAKPPPAPAAGLTVRERQVSRAVHLALYGLMIVLPVTGWVIVSASAYNLPTLLYGVVPWPHIGPVHDLSPALRRGVDARVSVVHAYLAWSLAALAALHVAAVLKHGLVDRDGVMHRMLPRLRRKPHPAPEFS